jgi:hypothetical protein
MIEEVFKWLSVAILGLLMIYLVVRVASAAFFKSRQQFNKEAEHEPQR